MGLSINCLHQGDCVSLLAEVAPGSIDLVFADPPFNIGYEYDVYEDRRSANEYLDWSRQWIQGVYAALKPDGSFWLAIGDEFAAELKLIAQNDAGFHCRSWVIWYYTFGVNCKNAFSRSHTHLFFFVKDPRQFTFNAENPQIRVPSARQLVYGDPRANPQGRLPDNTWILRPQDLPEGFLDSDDTWYYPRVNGTFKEREGFHGCQMPEQVLGRIIRVSSNPMETVLDPFAGSGTTPAVAKKLGRQWVGFELSTDYAKHVAARLEAANEGDALDGVADPLASVPATKSKQARRLGQRASGAGRGNGKAKNGAQTKSATARSKNGHADGELSAGIVAAYEKSHDGRSVDHVLAHPDLNAAFARACRQAKLPGDRTKWNKTLLRVRKNGKLPKASNRGQVLTFAEMDAYSFASEIALGQLALDWEISIDEILCNPKLAEKFDETAARVVGGRSPFEYRWAALAIRKRAQLAKRMAKKQYAEWERCRLPRAAALDRAIDRCKPCSGVYVLVDEQKQPLYAGETLNLVERLKHAAASEFWQKQGASTVRVIEDIKSPYALQSQLVTRLQPRLNAAILASKVVAAK